MELYEIMRLRASVFVLEQRCFYQDLDYLDLQAIHFCFSENNQIIAYTRILPSAGKEEVRLGRVLVRPSHRGQYVGKKLIQDVLKYLAMSYPHWPVVISAQYHLEKLYRDFGFVSQGEPYDLDGIRHITMRYHRE